MFTANGPGSTGARGAQNPMTLGVLFRNVPWTSNRERGKAARRSRLLDWLLKRRGKTHTQAIYGAHVAAESLVEAVLQHGTFEHYHLFAPPHLVRAVAACLPQGQARVSVHGFDEFNRGFDADRVTAWFDPWPNFGMLSYCRSAWSRKLRPVTILHHALSYSRILHQIVLPILLADSFPCDSIVCTSTAARRALRSLVDRVAQRLEKDAGVPLRYHGRFDLIPLGVNVDLFRPREKAELRVKLDLPRNACTILFLGRLSFIDKADLHPLLLAFREIVAEQKSSTKVLLVLAGSDPAGYSRALEAFIAELGLKKSVRIMLQPLETHLLLAAADIFVSPADSLQESFGLSVIEAAACGVPQVVSDWDGYRDTVQHGVTGFLVPTYWARCDSDICKTAPLFGNEWDYDHALLGQSVIVDWAKLKEYLQLLIDNPDLREEMGKRSRECALSHYSWPVIVKQYESLWSELAQCAGERTLTGVSRMSYTQPAYFDTFSHYATEILTDASRLQITALGQSLLAGRGIKLDRHPAVRTGLVAEDFLLRALDLFNAEALDGFSPDTISGGRALNEVTESMLKESGVEVADYARRHILWLLKQGYIELVPGERACGSSMDA